MHLANDYKLALEIGATLRPGIGTTFTLEAQRFEQKEAKEAKIWVETLCARSDALPRDPAQHLHGRSNRKNRRSYWCTKSEARIAALR